MSKGYREREILGMQRRCLHYTYINFITRISVLEVMKNWWLIQITKLYKILHALKDIRISREELSCQHCHNLWWHHRISRHIHWLKCFRSFISFKKINKTKKLTFPSKSKTEAFSSEVDCICPNSHCPFCSRHQTRSFWNIVRST